MDDRKHQSRPSCHLTTLQLKQSLIVLSCFQALRALWQVWDSVDDRWPVSIHRIMQPTIYASCSLVLVLMLISTSSTYSVYKAQQESAAVGWWAYYIVTLFYIITNFIFLSLLYMNKRNFITGCFQSRGINPDSSVGIEINEACSHNWQETMIWAALDTIVSMVVNTMFIYILHRWRVDQHNSDKFTLFKPVNSTTTTLNDISNENEFHVIDLNKE